MTYGLNDGFALKLGVSSFVLITGELLGEVVVPRNDSYGGAGILMKSYPSWRSLPFRFLTSCVSYLLSSKSVLSSKSFSLEITFMRLTFSTSIVSKPST